MKKTTRRSKQSTPVDVAASFAIEKQHYEERIRQLEQENNAYETENAELKKLKGDDSSDSNDGVEKLKKEYLQKLNLLEDQVSELKKKLGSQSQFSTHRKKADESTRQLQYEIQNLKAQKAKLQYTNKLESVRFRLSKALLEKEVLQLKKEGRRNEIKTCSLLTSIERLKMVLQRKTEEASVAIKRLRDMIAARKATSNRSSGAKNKSSQVIQDAEHELEVTTQLHKLCSQYESKIEKMIEENAHLKEEIEMQRQDNSRSELREEDLNSPTKDYDDIQDLKEQVDNLSCLLKELQLQKEKNEPRDKSQKDLAHALSEASYATAKMDTLERTSSNENSVKRGRADEGLCCSCSKKSLCKTTKCKCRSTGGSCGPSCGCSLSKCTNRELGTLPENESLKLEDSECSTNKDGETVIASECAKLLQNALVQKPANQVPKKKPLCDIQNSLGNMDAQKKGRKKNVRKPAIHLVTKDPMSSSP
ncbi:unnamed protein product [Lathyrus oleraceus]|uniref:Tesmin/TSO1-like CXC domain-containing protein n=1 Tax=Pisum sativum TaxID=3888 RepID=A0A9D4WMT7_PEA|nr:kinesin-like protein KIN-4C [Pisum sativum]KAI5404494.1 hypothetical protein KIW84_051595 [Pisum sativum]